ncbi:MAG: nucleoside monophosphate kinase [Verrucomicrobiota bacterium]
MLVDAPQRPRAYVFIGPPASGKGTHCRVIGSLPGFCHLSTGQAFRRLVERGDADAGLLARIATSTASGDLLPDEVAQEAARRYLTELVAEGRYDPARDILLLDGIPRTAGQAAWLGQSAEVLGVYEFRCSPEVSLERAGKRARKENRADDANLDIVRHRLEVYARELADLLGSYPAELITPIDTSQPPHHVLRAVLAPMA